VTGGTAAPGAGRGPATRLARRLGLLDAVVIGLGAMIGAGVFAAIGPAAAAAGNGLLLGLVIAAALAYCNATSVAQLAAIHPESGGAYVYGRERLGAFFGFLAGWGFVIGKLASCAAIALTFATHVAPGSAQPLAVGAIAALTAVNCAGVTKTAATTKVIVALVLLSLLAVVAGVSLGGAADPGRLWPLAGATPRGVLQSAGILFFAFAGYARIATLGEEVVEPAVTIPRAILLALSIALLVYAAVAASALLAVDAPALAASEAPLATAVEAGSLDFLSPPVRIGAAAASAGVLLSLLAGVSRTTFAMAAKGDLPGALAAVHSRTLVPHRAEVAVGIAAAAVVAVADVVAAIGFSSFAVLHYYAVANAAALTLPPADRRWPRGLAWVGLGGCLALAFSLPAPAVVSGAATLAAGALGFALRRRPRRRS
jgi:APA family basic amino acid/polyamine antiporter